MAKKKGGGTNTVLVIGAIAGGAYLLSKSGGVSPSTFLNIFPSGDSGGGLFGGGTFGEPFDMGGFMGGLRDIFSGIKGGQGGTTAPFDFNAFLDALMGRQGGGTTPPTAPTSPEGGGYPPSQPNTIPNILNALGYSAKSIGQGALMAGGAVLGFRALAPVAPAVGRAIAQPLATGARGALNLAGRGLTGLGAYLTTPVTALGVTGTIAAIPLVAAAGYGGYKAGEALMRTPVGESMLNLSGQAGAAFARSSLGAKVYGYATTSTRTQLIQQATALGYRAGTPEYNKFVNR